MCLLNGLLLLLLFFVMSALHMHSMTSWQNGFFSCLKPTVGGWALP